VHLLEPVSEFHTENEFRQVIVASRRRQLFLRGFDEFEDHDERGAVGDLKIDVLVEKIRDLGLYGLSQQGPRPLPQDFSELIVKGSWLNQFEYVIVQHGISLLRWKVEASTTPHDMPPFRFLPSRTFSDSLGQLAHLQ